MNVTEAAPPNSTQAVDLQARQARSASGAGGTVSVSDASSHTLSEWPVQSLCQHLLSVFLDAGERHELSRQMLLLW